MRDPLAAPALAMAGGVWLGQWCGLTVAEAGLGAAGFVFLWLAAKLGARRMGAACALLACGMAGALSWALHAPGKTPELNVASGEAAVLEGCVVLPPDADPERMRFTLELEPGRRVRVTQTLTAGEAAQRLNYGDRVELEARIRTPRNFRNPGAFDWEGYLARRGVYWQAAAAEGPVKVLSGECGTKLERHIQLWRAAGLRQLDELFPQPQSRALLRALLLGDGSALQESWKETFQRTGTYHAIVVSGTHITTLAGAVLLLLRCTLAPELWALAVAAALGWLYTLIVGAEAPAARSAAFFTLYLVARILYRRIRILNALGAIALAALALDPGQMFEASFQLSFLAVAAIGAFAQPVFEQTTQPLRKAASGLAESQWDAAMDARRQSARVELRLLGETLLLWTKLPEKAAMIAVGWTVWSLVLVAEMFLLTLFVQLALALPMALYFHRVSVTGLTANLLVTPALTAAIPLGFAALCTGWSAPVAVTGWLVEWSVRIAQWHVPLEPRWRVPDPPLWLASALVAFLLLTGWSLRRKCRWGWVAAGAAVISLGMVVAHPFAAEATPGWLEVDMLDVAQGDSLLVVFPEGQTLLVDAGGFPHFPGRPRPRIDTGEDVVSPYLWWRGMRRLDYVALTHGHADHAGGLAAVIDNFRPRELWTGLLPGGMKFAGVPQRALRRGDRMQVGGVEVDVLAPMSAREGKAAAHNDDSLVLRLRYGRHTILLTGDAGRAVEEEIGEAVGRADILKVGHHGSYTATSEKFLARTHPAFALISAGELNSYGLPHRHVLEELQRAHARVYRTDRDGLIRIRTNGRRLEIGPARGGLSAPVWGPD